MKKIVAIACSVAICAGASFACTYDEETHTLTECTEYVRGEGEIADECQAAHNAYNKYVASQVGKKAKKAATKAGNAVVKFVGDVVKDAEKTRADNKAENKSVSDDEKRN